MQNNFHKKMVRPIYIQQRQSRGFTLIEVLIAILIVTFSLLGFIGLQAQSTAASSNTKIRADAAQLANSIIGIIWADRGNALNFSLNAANGATCQLGINAGPVAANFVNPISFTNTNTWLTQVIGQGPTALPNASSYQQVVNVVPVPALANNYFVTVRLCWTETNDAQQGIVHSYTVTTQIQG